MPKDSILMDKSELIKSKELEYVTFLFCCNYLYDKLNRDQAFSSYKNYKFCNNLAKKYLKSDEYENSPYIKESMDEWFSKNKDIILEKYKNYMKRDKER